MPLKSPVQQEWYLPCLQVHSSLQTSIPCACALLGYANTNDFIVALTVMAVRGTKESNPHILPAHCIPFFCTNPSRNTVSALQVQIRMPVFFTHVRAAFSSYLLADTIRFWYVGTFLCVLHLVWYILWPASGQHKPEPWTRNLNPRSNSFKRARLTARVRS